MDKSKEGVKSVISGPLWVIVAVCLVVFTMPSIVKALIDPTYSKIGADTVYVMLWFWAPGLIIGFHSIVRLLK